MWRSSCHRRSDRPRPRDARPVWGEGRSCTSLHHLHMPVRRSTPLQFFGRGGLTMRARGPQHESGGSVFLFLRYSTRRIDAACELIAHPRSLQLTTTLLWPRWALPGASPRCWASCSWALRSFCSSWYAAKTHADPQNSISLPYIHSLYFMRLISGDQDLRVRTTPHLTASLASGPAV